MGAAGLTGILLLLHKSLLWNFPFLTSVFALLPLLAIYSVSAGTHWWVCSSDEYSCVDSWHGFSGFIFSYFVHIDCTFLSFEKKHLGPLNWRTSISLRFYHQGNIVNELSLKFSALLWLFVPNRCSLLGSWNLLSASFENVINWAGSFITGLNFVAALDTPEGLCNDLDIVYTWQSF